MGIYPPRLIAKGVFFTFGKKESEELLRGRTEFIRIDSADFPKLKNIPPKNENRKGISLRNKPYDIRTQEIREEKAIFVAIIRVLWYYTIYTEKGSYKEKGTEG